MRNIYIISEKYEDTYEGYVIYIYDNGDIYEG